MSSSSSIEPERSGEIQARRRDRPRDNRTEGFERRVSPSHIMPTPSASAALEASLMPRPSSGKVFSSPLHVHRRISQ